MLEPEEIAAIQEAVSGTSTDILPIIIQGGAVGMMVVVLIWLIPKFISSAESQRDAFLRSQETMQETMMTNLTTMSNNTTTALNNVASRIEENTVITRKLEQVLDEQRRSPSARTRASDYQEHSHG